MEKAYQKTFRNQIIASGLLTLAVCVGIVIGFIMLSRSYVPDRIQTDRGTVTDVYRDYKRHVMLVELSDGTELRIVKGAFQQTERATGYSLSELEALLTGREIDYAYHAPGSEVRYLTRIQAGDTVLDLSEPCATYCRECRIGGVLLGGMLIAMAAIAEAEYIKVKHRVYKKMKKKEERSSCTKKNNAMHC